MSNQGPGAAGQAGMGGQAGKTDGVAFDPALLNANAAVADFNVTSNPSTGSSSALPPAIAAALSSNQSSSSLNPAQLQQLTEFHRKQQLQRSAIQANPPSASSSPAQSQLVPPLPDHIRQHIAPLSKVEKDAFFKQWLPTEEGQRFSRLMQQRNMPLQQQRQGASTSQAVQSSPAASSNSAPTSTIPPIRPGSSSANPNSTNIGPSSGVSTPERRESYASVAANIPVTQAFNPASYRSIPNQNQNQNQTPQSQASTPRPPNAPIHPQLNRGPTTGVFNSNSNSTSQWVQQTPYRPNNDYMRPQPTPAPPRRKEEGMRGTMRSELARLMYASGDVENPDTDTIDYMEDLVVDWLAELCAPPPPVRSHPSAPLATPRLDYEIIRHRLSRPSMRKYLDRFEYMGYKAVDMRSARRVARGNFEPVDQKDLDRQLEKGFLDAEDSGALPGQAKKKRKYKRTAPTAGEGVVQGEGQVQRRKPGPKKGWKKSAIGARGSSTPARGSSIKPEENQ